MFLKTVWNKNKFEDVFKEQWTPKTVAVELKKGYTKMSSKEKYYN